MPKEIYGATTSSSRAKELLSFEEIARVVGIFAASACATCASRAASRSCAGTSRADRAAARDPGLDLALTTNGVAAAAEGAGARATRASTASPSASTPSTTTPSSALNDVDFPVQKVLDGIDAAAAAGLPVKVNAVVKRGVNDDGIVALAEQFRGRATCCASSSTWTSARRTAGGSTTSSPPRDRRDDRRRPAAGAASRPPAPTRPPSASATTTAPARSASSPR